nr:AAA family ATPase [Methylomarinum sp. Ch1-1]MDP4519380.1 AAA family ATPase [Methylomarinum sp. Ch1-1]
MKVWSVSNQKGGVGKTTTVVTLGGLLSSWGFNTLLVDLDPHGSLTSYFKMNPDEMQASVYNLFHDASLKKKTAGRNLISSKPSSTAFRCCRPRPLSRRSIARWLQWAAWGW